jgi:uncharacterized protein (TIGR02300 family)
VTKPELGIKRTCSGCGAKFYDLHKDPIICPKCETVLAPVATTPTRPRPGGRRPVATGTVSTPGAEISKAPVEKLDGERFIVPDEQDDDEEVGGTIANDETDKDEET